MSRTPSAPALASVEDVAAILNEQWGALTADPAGNEDAVRALAELPRWWFSRARPEVVAAEIGMCARPLDNAEVRTLYRPAADPSVCLISVAGSSGNALLPGLAAVLADEGLLVARAEMVTWRSAELIRTTVLRPGVAVDDVGWRRICDRISGAVGTDDLPLVDFAPQGPVSARLVPAGERTMVVVEAPHRVGLLWATSAWLTAAGFPPEEMQTESSGPVRQSAYLVRGRVDTDALVAVLAGPTSGWVGLARGLIRPAVGLPRLVLRSARRLLG